ncbi:YpuI family protein [Bacillus sp. FJAT-27251]|uniref:YpuI family protein n=1 Tax=Bacillus sp. FJAT-27251 TaxID=1684142 RepID=UPI0006A7E62C|nr:YpuI family protein [Bacillus sp. FJAT-27251]
MGNTIVETQVKEVKDFLGSTVEKLEAFLNTTTLKSLAEEEPGDADYYRHVLSSIRRLAVFCEEGLEACKVIAGSQPFSKGAAEKTLYRIYIHCIEEFYSPKSDIWFEDSRAAYTGKNAIKFRDTVPAKVTKLLASLEGDFQQIREELEYYETDYRTKMLQSK